MADVHIYQIFYSDATRRQLDPGFLPLDNTGNARPDWREYWPIRNFLQSQTLIATDYYAFFSPKFREKTGLSSETVREFIASQPPDTDVVLFSPYFDQIALYLNPWEQGAMQHVTAAAAFQASLGLLAPHTLIGQIVSSSRDCVFCNYFAAKPAFWRDWLRGAEQIFAIAERADTDLGRALCSGALHDWQSTPTKTFVIERIASLMLATQSQWRVKAYNSMLLPRSPAPIGALTEEMAALDALKIAYRLEGHPDYLKAFFELRKRFVNMLGDPKA